MSFDGNGQKSLALELGPAGVRVNVVSPGLTITDATNGIPEQQKAIVARMTPMGRPGRRRRRHRPPRLR